MNYHSPLGSLWKRWDLHFHTPASYDYKGGSTVSNKQIVEVLIEKGVRVVAITDHHTMDIVSIKEMQALGAGRLTVLPGIELRSDQGGHPIHYICIFPEDCDLEHVWPSMQGTLGLTSAAITAMGGDDKVYVPIEKGAELARRLGGIVTIHAGSKSNSIEEIKNKEQFQQRIKFDITKDWVDMMEVGQLKDIDVHLRTIFPAIGLERPLIICSDNHDIADYAVKTPLWFRADPAFRGLQMVCREPIGRIFIGEKPDEIVRVEQNPTKYIKRIEYQRRATAPASEKWFSGDVKFSTGLVAIIGNKGSGKSALADTLGLLGASKNADVFSFLSANRFRRPGSGGLAQYFDASIIWESGETGTRCLNDTIAPTEIERLKYLPQDHVEKVCNELAGSEETGFEKELKSVIFSHVPEALRLGQTSLDELVRFRTGEKQKRIDTLVRQLKETSRARAAVEDQSNPDSKREIEDKIKQRLLEIDAHDKVKPPVKHDPKTEGGSTPPDPKLLGELTAAEIAKKTADTEISNEQEALRIAERRHAVAKRLLEKLSNFGKEFEVFKKSLSEDALELNLDSDSLVAFELKKDAVEKIRNDSVVSIARLTKALSPDEPAGLRAKAQTSAAALATLQSKLDEPNRAYQIYLKELSDWQEKRAKLEGSESDLESLKGLNAALTSFADLPEKIKLLCETQSKIALEIHQEKIAQAEVFRSLYQPVQEFINTHTLAKDKLKLEFKAELTNEDFANRLMGLLALNRKGSFMGVDEGRIKIGGITESIHWDDPASVRGFLSAMDTALHNDQRETPPKPVQLRDQLVKLKKPEDVFDLLYGLEFVKPRYILRWDGKDLAMLSPGERGTLLLVFYLLIDKSDIPLVIDQPEGNLDNHTVAKVLVECIREARRRRQVFIVTHNPNLAVVCDADQVVHAEINKGAGNAITYTSGALENPNISKYVTDVLEGTRWAFGVRGSKYEIGE